MRIAIFDYKITPNNPIGSCHLRMIQGLCKEHEFTVFAVEFENPCPERVRFVRIPVPTRPLALLFVAYHLMAPLIFFFYRLLTGTSFDLVQIVESNVSFGDLSYTQFCHRAYLDQHWKEIGARGLRGWLRWLDHWLHALMEPWVFHKVERIVVPSQGLKRELEETYPFVRDKIIVISNPADLDHMPAYEGFDRVRFRREQGANEDNVVLVFVALGQFERKGLPLLLEALRLLSNPQVKLWVVGGEVDLVRLWQSRVRSMGLSEQVTFFGMQGDVRPFYWSADAFVFPSYYEAFPLVTIEAAAAGLPLIVTRLYGVEEFVQDGETGFIIERSVVGVLEGIQRFLGLSPMERVRMGLQAREAVSRYSIESFIQNWRAFYESSLLG